MKHQIPRYLGLFPKQPRGRNKTFFSRLFSIAPHEKQSQKSIATKATSPAKAHVVLRLPTGNVTLRLGVQQRMYYCGSENGFYLKTLRGFWWVRSNLPQKHAKTNCLALPGKMGEFKSSTEVIPVAALAWFCLRSQGPLFLRQLTIIV